MSPAARSAHAPAPVAGRRARAGLALVLAALAAGLLLVTLLARPAGAQVAPQPTVPVPPATAPGGTQPLGDLPALPEVGPPLDGDTGAPATPGAGGSGDQTITIGIGGEGDAPSQSILVILGIGVLAVAPSLVIMLTSFTRIVIVLSLTRNALGLQGVPPNQVLAGLALFLSLFVMGPTLTQMNDVGLQPYLRGELTQGEAFTAASAPLKEFMLSNTRQKELKLMADAAGEKAPEDVRDVGLTALVPAFILSELKTAFIIGFVIFVPFVVIDLVVSAVLMSLGMMMLPPVTISLPFKVLLFVMVGGWSLVVETLLAAYN